MENSKLYKVLYNAMSYCRYWADEIEWNDFNEKANKYYGFILSITTYTYDKKTGKRIDYEKIALTEDNLKEGFEMLKNADPLESTEKFYQHKLYTTIVKDIFYPEDADMFLQYCMFGKLKYA